MLRPALGAPLRAALRSARRRGDAGQAFPLYLTAVAGLLFLALAYFAVGRAGAIRNEGQTAADAAALAAAQAHRDQLRTALLRSVLDGGDWADLLQGRGPGAPAACAEAARFADRNGADLTGAGCLPGYLPTSFTVTVRTRDTVGRSVIPGTEDRHARATARAVVEPRCVPDPVAVPPSPGPTASRPGAPGGRDGTAGDGDEDEDEAREGAAGDGDEDEDEAREGAAGDEDEGGDEARDGSAGDEGEDGARGNRGGKPPLGLDCDGEPLVIDPGHPELFPEAKDLFSVRLADR
ncbi:hypothetical protein [Streptomyces pactum]|uniref:hypothetical protein n=1 Tax=Streptomyces pactum TaxID=68249 RepID=UPI0036FB6675